MVFSRTDVECFYLKFITIFLSSIAIQNILSGNLPVIVLVYRLLKHLRELACFGGFFRVRARVWPVILAQKTQMALSYSCSNISFTKEKNVF
jgi:hypothetical protein